jgi:hypothetical protein
MSCTVKILITACLWLPVLPARAQNRTIKGRVLDEASGQPIEAADVYLPGTNTGTFTDADGRFTLVAGRQADSIGVSYVGYATLTAATGSGAPLVLKLKANSRALKEVTVYVKHGDRAEDFMKKVIAHKPYNDPDRFANYSFRAYNKAELDLNNYKPKHGKELPARMQAMFNKLDTANIKNNQLPIYFIETLSKNYHSKAAARDEEQVIAKRSLGLETDKLIRRLEKFQVSINIYDNWIALFDKTFISPLADNGFGFYKYYLDDSVKKKGQTSYYITFEPRNSYEQGFIGAMWVDDSSYSVHSIEMAITKNANLNYVQNISFRETFALYPAGDGKQVYMPKKYVTDLQFEAGLDLLGIPVHRDPERVKMDVINSKVYDSIKVNVAELPNPDVQLKNQDQKDQYARSDDFWKKNRSDSLSLHEAAIYKMMDTLKQAGGFDFDTKVLAFAGTGYWDVKDKYRFGPYSSFLSFDKVEGLRTRCGFWTLPKIDEHWNLNCYLAYGSKDGKFKGGLGVKYLHSTTRWSKTYLYARSDYDLIIDYDDELDHDNIISSVLRKNVPSFRSYIQEVTLGHEEQLSKDVMNHSSLRYRIYNPVFPFSYHPENPKTELPDNAVLRHVLPVTEFNTNFRITKDQKTIIVNYDLLNLDHYNPVFNIGYTYGFETGKDQFSYHKVTASIEQNLRLPPKMYLFYKLSAGCTVGTVPYILLNVPQGNEYYVSSKYLFNTMVPYEFAADKYVSLQTRFSGGGILLDRVPLLQKLGWRERLTFNSFLGGLSAGNQKFNAANNITVADKVPFAEAGVGIENIFHAVSVEYIRRLSYRENIYQQKGGLYLGVQLNF